MSLLHSRKISEKESPQKANPSAPACQPSNRHWSAARQARALLIEMSEHREITRGELVSAIVSRVSPEQLMCAFRKSIVWKRQSDTARPVSRCLLLAAVDVAARTLNEARKARWIVVIDKTRIIRTRTVEPQASHHGAYKQARIIMAELLSSGKDVNAQSLADELRRRMDAGILSRVHGELKLAKKTLGRPCVGVSK